MDLLQNPFHILTASSRDNRRRIMELAEERSLVIDSGVCIEAHSCLTNPRKRLSAEVAWLPGMGPKRVGEMLSLLESSPMELLALDKLSSIARLNLLAAGVARLSSVNPEDVSKWILEIAWEFEYIDSEELAAILNEERIVSGFPEVTDLSVVEAEIQERRRHYLQAIKKALNNLSAKDLVESVTKIVEEATEDGEDSGPVLIADLVDSYEVEAQGFLTREEGNIKALVEKLRAAVDSMKPDTELSPAVNQLIRVVKNWDAVAQPIQLCAKSRGLGHDASRRIAWLVRNLAVDIFNKHGKLDLSQQLTGMLQEVFAEVGDVAEQIEEDVDALGDIAEQRGRLIEEAKSKSAEWRREITYEAEIGLIFKDKLCISPEGLEWKGRFWDLDSITRIRWGGIRHSVNGIPTGTTYCIFFGNSTLYESIELSTQSVYNDFIDRLWKAVGVRLLTEYLEGVRDGRNYTFGSAVMTDFGMELEHRSFFGRKERVFCKWSDLVIWNEPGAFCVGKASDKKFKESFSYLDEDNVNVLETLLRIFWKRSGDRLSSLLEDR